MVMGEDISRLMDGELDDGDVDALCGRLQRPDGKATWVCYHLIGDALRGSGSLAPGFAQRFAARFAAEPTVLAPNVRKSRPLPFVWAVAATVAAVAVVGWVALTTLDAPAIAIAKARAAGAVRSAQVRPQAVPADYLLAHQEYSPTAQIQGVGPNLRAVSAPAADASR
jgi:sigma-E factor negative regulatory protein RseA